MEEQTVPEPDLEAIECAKAYFKRWRWLKQIRPVRDTSTPHMFFAGGSLVVVCVNPKHFPPLLTKWQRQRLLDAADRDGRWHSILLLHVKHHPPEKPYVVRFKPLPGYRPWERYTRGPQPTQKD